MSTRSYSIPQPGVDGVTGESYFNQSVNSGKVNGKLVLRANGHEFDHRKVTMYSWNGSDRAFKPPGTNGAIFFPFTSDQTNEVYAKFVGKLRQGSGSLGVTLASWGQSRAMIIERLSKINKIFDKVERRRRKNPRRKKYSSRTLASDFLEGEFGWVPLLGDIHAIASTIVGGAFPREWVKATSRFPFQQTMVTEGFPKLTRSGQGHGRVTYAAAVEVSNPNLWLLNRMGVINPLTVAWDLVPWSFVVNMFVNVNQVLSSLTDTVGLTLSNASVTQSSHILTECETYTRWSDSEAYYSRSNILGKYRYRAMGSIPKPSLALKLPKANFELLAIASALTRQKVGSLR